MIKVDLDKIGLDIPQRQKAVMWLFDRYGPAGDTWKIDKLTYVKFKNDKDATFFILRWS
jgi:hypothetical protein